MNYHTVDYSSLAIEALQKREEEIVDIPFSPLWQTIKLERNFTLVPTIFNTSSNSYLVGVYIALRFMRPRDEHIYATVNTILCKLGVEATSENADKVTEALNALGYFGVIDLRDYTTLGPDDPFDMNFLSDAEIVKTFGLAIRTFEESVRPADRKEKFAIIHATDIEAYKAVQMFCEALSCPVSFPEYLRLLAVLLGDMKFQRIGDCRERCFIYTKTVTASTLQNSFGIAEVSDFVNFLKVIQACHVAKVSVKKKTPVRIRKGTRTREPELYYYISTYTDSEPAIIPTAFAEELLSKGIRLPGMDLTAEPEELNEAEPLGSDNELDEADWNDPPEIPDIDLLMSDRPW